MARLWNMPNLVQVQSMFGVIDFAVWRGRPYARAWPRWTVKTRSAAVQNQIAEFKAVTAAITLVQPELKEIVAREYTGYGWTWHDAMIAWAFGTGVIDTVLKIPEEDMPASALRVVAGQSIPAGTWTALTLVDPPLVDAAALWNSATPTRLTSAAGGVYRIDAHLDLPLTYNYWWRLAIYVNGTEYAVNETWIGLFSSPWGVDVGAICTLAAGDYVELFAYQSYVIGQNVVTGSVSALKLSL